MKTLDEILEGGEEAAPVDGVVQMEQQPEVVQEPEAGPARDEHGRFAPKGVDDGAPPAPDKLPPEEYKALKEERVKRQTLEQQLADMQQKFEALNQPKEPPAPPPSIWEDEQGALQHYGNQIVSQATLNARLDMSEMLVRQANPDFDEMKETFVSLMKENPSLQQQALSDPHPWNKAYQIAKNHKAMQELSAVDVTDLKAKLREEIMAEMAGQPAAKPTLPVSLTNERSVGQRSGPAWSGPPSLNDILNQ